MSFINFALNRRLIGVLRGLNQRLIGVCVLY